MGKQTGIILLLLLIVLGGFSANNDETSISKASPAVRNTICFNYQQLSGNEITQPIDLSDDFNMPVLRSHWSTEIENSTWSLKDRPGFLRLRTQENSSTENTTGTTFSQKIDIHTTGEVISYIDLSNLKEGDATGLFISNSDLHYIGVKMIKGEKIISVVSGSKTIEVTVIEANGLMLKTNIETSKATFEYCVDGLNFQKIETTCKLNVFSKNESTVGIFYNNQTCSEGTVDVDWFYLKNKKETKVQFAELVNSTDTF